MSRLPALLLLIPLLAACGGSSASPSSSATASTKPSAVASASAAATPSNSLPSESPGASPAVAAQQLTCAPTGPGWSSANLDKPADAETGTTAAAKALAEFITGPSGADLPDTGWRELYRSKEVALYGQDDPSGEPGVLLVATVRATNGSWSGEDSGQCRPRTWLGTSLGIAADWKLAAKTSKTSTSIKLLVTERACASGETATGRIAKPKISYEADRVVITIGVKPLTGTQDCQANAATPLTITLTEALGSRQLYDGGPYPSLLVAQPK